jgi:hypothetical protein
MKYQEGALYTYFRKKALTLLSNFATVGRERDIIVDPCKKPTSV